MTEAESLTIVTTTLFRKDVKRAARRGLDLAKLRAVLLTLAQSQVLPPASRDHMLTGNYAGNRECHIQPDWLLIYRIDNDELALIAVRTGTHADLF